ncbi:MAG: hypothetical protein U5N86_05630 [Planctomycetota bacterium]|nr:hypothetical protein [Planctomycetota bacterium]
MRKRPLKPRKVEEDVPELEPLPDEEELRGKPFGEILLALQLIDEPTMVKALEEQQKLKESDRPVHIGELLLKWGKVERKEVVKALFTQGKQLLECDTCSVIASREPSTTTQRVSCPNCFGRLLVMDGVELRVPRGHVLDLELLVRTKLLESLTRTSGLSNRTPVLWCPPSISASRKASVAVSA